MKPELELILFSMKVHQYQSSAKHIGNGRGDSNALHSQSKADDKYQIQNDIDGSGQYQIVHRSFGVSVTSENRRTKIINGHKRNTNKVNPDIQQGFVNHALWSAGCFQYGSGGKKSKSHQNHAQNHTKGQNCMYHSADAVSLPLADQIRQRSIGTNRQSYNQINENADQRDTASHRCQCRRTCKSSYHRHIRGVK